MVARARRNCQIAASITDPPTAFWDSQQTYGKPQNSLQKSKLPFNKPNHKIKCYNCNRIGHYAWKCRNPKNVTNNVTFIMNNRPNRTNRILN